MQKVKSEKLKLKWELTCYQKIRARSFECNMRLMGYGLWAMGENSHYVSGRSEELVSYLLAGEI